MDYKEFLRKKELQTIQSGFKVDKSKLNPMTFDFQRDVIAWALEKGIGIELKTAYFDEAVRNMKNLEVDKNQVSLFDMF